MMPSYPKRRLVQPLTRSVWWRTTDTVQPSFCKHAMLVCFVLRMRGDEWAPDVWACLSLFPTAPSLTSLRHVMAHCAGKKAASQSFLLVALNVSDAFLKFIPKSLWPWCIYTAFCHLESEDNKYIFLSVLGKFTERVGMVSFATIVQLCFDKPGTINSLW